MLGQSRLFGFDRYDQPGPTTQLAPAPLAIDPGSYLLDWCRFLFGADPVAVQGLAAVALRGALDLIAKAGGGLVEGYPHDTGGVRKKNSSFLYNGTRTMYEREGFTYDRPKG